MRVETAKGSKKSAKKPVINATVISNNRTVRSRNNAPLSHFILGNQSEIMTEKKLINSPDTCVDECLYGFSKSHPKLVLYSKERVLFDGCENASKKVAVISGGGAGHEPFAAGYVGYGMLTAAISGSVFASPPSGNIMHAIRTAASQNNSVFLIIPNYTGDVLNFGLSVELAKSEGIQIESVTVGEDVALEAYGIECRAGRRGMCGLVVLFKIAGYLSAIGENLETVEQVSKKALDSMASIGLSVAACSLPGSGLLFRLEEDEMELGVGVHGEAGVQRTKMKTAAEVVALFLKHLTEYLKIGDKDEVSVFVNNLGALSNVEQWLIAGEVEKQLTEKGVKVARIYAGPLFTSLNMSGVQVCLLKLTPDTKDLFLKALDFKTEASGWPGRGISIPDAENANVKQNPVKEVADSPKGAFVSSKMADLIKKCISNASASIIANEKRLNDLDSGCGDGDCGTTLRHLAREVESEKGLLFERPAALSNQLASIAQKAMGGTSGAIYSLFFTSVARELEKYEELSGSKVWSASWRAGIDGIKKYSVARVGDRTMFDSLEPACEEFEKFLERNPKSGLEAFKSAVESARKGCQKTRTMKALAGRASYVDRSQLKDVDAGACAVTIWLSAVNDVLQNS